MDQTNVHRCFEAALHAVRSASVKYGDASGSRLVVEKGEDPVVVVLTARCRVEAVGRFVAEAPYLREVLVDPRTGGS